MQYNVKTHVWREVEGSNLIMIDHRTGSRPDTDADARSDRPAAAEVQDAVQGAEHQPRAPRLHRLLIGLRSSAGRGSPDPRSGSGARPDTARREVLWVRPGGCDRRLMRTECGPCENCPRPTSPFSGTESNGIMRQAQVSRRIVPFEDVDARSCDMGWP